MSEVFILKKLQFSCAHEFISCRSTTTTYDDDEEQISGENKKSYYVSKATDRHQIFFNLHMEQYILCFSIRKVRYFVLLYTYRYLCFAVCCYASHSHAFSRNSFFASQLMDCWKNFLLLLYKLFFWTKMKVAARLKRERKILNFFMVIVGWGRHSKSFKIELFKKVSQEIQLHLEGMKRERKTRLRFFNGICPVFFCISCNCTTENE